MSWTDKQSIKVINYLKGKYEIKEFVETGTFKGVNAKLHSVNFEEVSTCEKIKFNYEQSINRLKKCHNVEVEFLDSETFLREYKNDYKETKRKDVPLFYLDAHFYDPKMPKGKGKFVVLDELSVLRDFGKCVLIIHDFDNNLGHITYDGIDLNFDLVKHRLRNIHKFHYYTNTLNSCDIVKPNADDILNAGLDVDEETLDNLEYAWRTPRLTFRGLLYCVPTKLTDQEMTELGLKEI